MKDMRKIPVTNSHPLFPAVKLDCPPLKVRYRTDLRQHIVHSLSSQEIACQIKCHWQIQPSYLLFIAKLNLQEIVIMDTKSNSIALIDQQEKMKEIQVQLEKLKTLQAELAKLNLKIEKNEKLTPDESAYLGQLGWLSAAAVTIAAIATTI